MMLMIQNHSLPRMRPASNIVIRLDAAHLRKDTIRSP